jgi:hypothetical protein
MAKASLKIIQSIANSSRRPATQMKLLIVPTIEQTQMFSVNMRMRNRHSKISWKTPDRIGTSRNGAQPRIGIKLTNYKAARWSFWRLSRL